MPPQHFSPTGAIDLPPGDGPGFDTPLGRMVFVVSEFGEPVDVTAAWRTGPYTVWQWTNGVELMLNPRLAVTLPPGMTVSGAAAAVIRVMSDGDRVTSVGCLWSPRRPAWTHSHESGQDFDAVHWSNGTTRVTLGLPDPDNTVERRDDGYLVDVPPAAGRFQTHFVCAWASAKFDSLAAWFAVDQQPEDLLAVAD